MTTTTLIAYLFKSLLLPPGLNLVLALIAWICWNRWKKLAVIALSSSIFSLYLLSVPSIATHLLISLQDYPALSQQQLLALHKDNIEQPHAIVILSGGRRSKAPEYGQMDTLHPRTLERVRYGAYLHRKTQLPILVSGGSVFGEPTPEAVLMNQVLTDEYKLPVQWLESNSHNTLQNAQYSVELLKKNNITHIVLVTHAWHMARAKSVFKKQKIDVVPAPTGFVIRSDDRDLSYLPSAKALYSSFLALHEYVGRVWYAIVA